MEKRSLNIILHRATAYLIFFIFSYLIGPVLHTAQCEIREFQTTRMKSTAGTGVGAILFEESNFVNPAALAFYKSSSIYFQKVDGTQSKQPQTGNPDSSEMGTTAVILTDANGGLKGSFSYVDQTNGEDKRTQYGISVGALLSEKSAIGGGLLIKKDDFLVNGVRERNDYEQAIFGLTHLLSENINFGLTLVDPFRVREEDSKVIFGMQYIYEEFISLMVDMGSDYKENLEDKYLLRSAAQIRFLDDFFLRFGMFTDKAKAEKGNGIGVSWVTPKLTVDIAQSNVKKLELASNLDSDEISEFTFSLSLRF